MQINVRLDPEASFADEVLANLTHPTGFYIKPYFFMADYSIINYYATYTQVYSCKKYQVYGKNMLIKLLSIILLSGLLSSCATSPTGRSQLLIMSSGEMDQMGIQAFDTLKKDMPIEQDAKINAYVRCVATEIGRAHV